MTPQRGGVNRGDRPKDAGREREVRGGLSKHSGERCHRDPNAQAHEDSDRPAGSTIKEKAEAKKQTEEKEKAKEKKKLRYELLRLSSGTEKSRTSRFDFVALNLLATTNSLSTMFAKGKVNKVY